MNVAKEIAAFNAGRDPEGLQLKLRRMRVSSFAFLRGSCHLFYRHVPRSGLFRRAPLVWACGDLHPENFGSYKGDQRQVCFDINDFDEACLAPAVWDAVRLLASIQVGARSLGFSGSEGRQLAKVCAARYREALLDGKAYWVDHRTAQGLIARLLDGLKDRSRHKLLAQRTRRVDGQLRLEVDGRQALPASDQQKRQVGKLMRHFAARQPDPGFYQVLDVARRLAGTSSLGTERYVILIHGKGGPDGHYLLDLKAARPLALAARLKVAQPVWRSEAERVVESQRSLQAMPMAFLQPQMMGKRPFVLRGLQPTEDRIALSGLHAGLIEFASGRRWVARLLDTADACAHQTQADARQFNEAFDDGYFD